MKPTRQTSPGRHQTRFAGRRLAFLFSFGFGIPAALCHAESGHAESGHAESGQAESGQAESGRVDEKAPLVMSSGGNSKRGRGGSVKLEVATRSGNSRCLRVGAGGLPFPPGKLFHPAGFQLRDTDGKPLPTQTECVAHWPDGSVRWLGLQFLYRGEATRSRRLRGAYPLGRGTSTKPISPDPETTLRAEPHDEGIWVETGPFSWLVPRTPSLPILTGLRYRNRRLLGANGARAGLSLEAEIDGVVYGLNASTRRNIRLECQGPVAATIRLNDELTSLSGRAGIGVSVGVHAYAGLPFLRLEIRFSAPRWGSRVESLRLRLHPRRTFSARGAVSPDSHPRPLATISRNGLSIRSAPRDPETSTVKEGKSSRAPHRRTSKTSSLARRHRDPARVDAWGIHEAEGIRLLLVDPEFWIRPPRRITISEDEIELEFLDDPVPWRSGEVLSAEVLIGASLSTELGGKGRAVDAEAVGLPGLLFPSPGWLETSAERSSSTGKDDPDQSACLRSAGRFFDAQIGTIRSFRDVGDWRMGNGLSFGNLEFDTILGMTRQAVAKQSLVWGRRALLALHHFRDIDLSRPPEEDPFAEEPKHRAPWPHGPDHRGGPVELGHLWIEGPLEASLWFGDRTSLEEVRGVGRALIQLSKSDDIFAYDRNLGWSLIALASLDRLLGDRAAHRSLLELASKCTERLSAQTGTILFRDDRREDRGGIPDDEHRPISVSTWIEGGILAEGYFQAFLATGDPRFRRLLHGLAQFLVQGILTEKGTFPKPFALPNRILVDPQSGEVLDRRGRVLPENMILLGHALNGMQSSGFGISSVPPGLSQLCRRSKESGWKELRSKLGPEGGLGGGAFSKMLRVLPSGGGR